MTIAREKSLDSVPLSGDIGTSGMLSPEKTGIGMRPTAKRYHWNEIYGYFDPDSIKSPEKAPAHVQAAFDELIGKEPQFKLRLHPWFRRWACFQKMPGGGEGAYSCFSVFFGDPEEGWLPPDLDLDDHRYENLRGLMGCYRLPTKKDFEVIKRDADIQRLGVAGVAERLDAPEQAEEKEAERVLADKEWDVLDYNYLAINAAANGGKLQMIAPNRDNSEIIAKKEEEWHIETKTTEDGKTYKIRYKKGSRFYAEKVAEDMAAYLNDGESRKREAVAEFKQAEIERAKDEMFSLARDAIRP
jgi:hypothetical protein